MNQSKKNLAKDLLLKSVENSESKLVNFSNTFSSKSYAEVISSDNTISSEKISKSKKLLNFSEEEKNNNSEEENMSVSELKEEYLKL